MSIYIASFFIGIVAGLRAMMAPAAASWAAYLGTIHPGGSWLAFMGYRFTPWIFSVMAAGELLTDKLPQTPSRKVPVQFGTRVLMGGLGGATIGMHAGVWIAGAILGAIGAVVGTLGGANVRAHLATRLTRDRPAALIEDAVAIIGAILIVVTLR